MAETYKQFLARSRRRRDQIKRFIAKGRTQREAAERFGVSQARIWAVLRGK
jgi:transposase